MCSSFSSWLMIFTKQSDMTNSQYKVYLALLLLLLPLTFPNFIFGKPIGQLVSLYGLVVFSFLFLVCKHQSFNVVSDALLLFSALLALLVISSLNQALNLQEIQSMARPVGLYLITTVFYNILWSLKSIDKLYRQLDMSMLLIVVTACSYLLVESAFAPVEEYMYSLYVRENKKFHGSVSFYWVPYAAGFVFYSTFLYYLSVYKVFGYSLKTTALLGASILLIFSSQSGGIMLATLLAVLLLLVSEFWLAAWRGLLGRRLFVILAASLILFSLGLLHIDILQRASYAFRVLERLIFEFGSTGTIQTRLGQIELAWLSSLSNYGFGAGLGRGDNQLHLESWVAATIYRYGIIGVSVYVLWFMWLAYRLLKRHQVSITLHMRMITYFGFFWTITLPLSMVSGFQIETGKTAILSWFIVAVMLAVLRIDERNADLGGKVAAVPMLSFRKRRHELVNN